MGLFTPKARTVLTRNRAKARAFVRTVGPAQAQKVLKRAQTTLTKRIDAATATVGGDSFTVVHASATRAAIQDAVAQVQLDLASSMDVYARAAAWFATRNTMQWMDAIDPEMSALDIDSVGMFDAAQRGAEASLLRMRASMGDGGVYQRYGIATVADFESILQTAVLTGAPLDETVAALTSASPFLQGKPRYWAERIARTECFPGDTVVSGAVVRAVFRRWYEGPVVDIVTESGRKLTATPNHPMLTSRVWVAAGELREGDYLVCDTRQEHARAAGDEHVDHPPASLREVFDAVAAVGVVTRRATAEPDFHGDGRDGYVDVVRAHGSLHVGRLTPVSKPTAQRVFAPTHVGSAPCCAYCACLTPVNQATCFRCGTHVYTRSRQTESDSLFVRAVLGGQLAETHSPRVLVNHHAGNVTTFSGVGVLGVTEPRGLRPPARYLGVSCPTLHAVGRDARTSGDLASTGAPHVQLDRVVSVTVRPFAGHVYNLTTEDGYYTANSLYTKNCLGALNGAQGAAMDDLNDDLGDVVKVLVATFDNRTSWDSYLVHGQVRRLNEAFECVRYDGNSVFYLTPPGRPNDREVVVSWRLSWGPLPNELRALPLAACAARWSVMGSRKRPMPPRPPTVLDDELGALYSAPE